MSRFAFQDFHGVGCVRKDMPIPDLNPDGTVTASSFEEAFQKITGLQIMSNDQSDPFIRHVGAWDTAQEMTEKVGIKETWWTIAKVG